MIPVPLEYVYLLDIKNKSYGYKRLLSEQYSYINKTDNKKEILEKSKKIYDVNVNMELDKNVNLEIGQFVPILFH